MSSRRSRPGRPRHIPAIDSNLPPREQILDAAARLFTECGYAATSTREIADAVGIRQASLYYHFAGKEEILELLLERTLRPTLDQIEKIEKIGTTDGWAAALYALVMVDSKTLVDAPHNSGLLPTCPDVFSLELFEPYRETRRALYAAYERIGTGVAGLADICGIRLENHTAVVIRHRADDVSVTPRMRHAIAASALRICGASEQEITLASAVAWAELLENKETP